MLNCLEGVLVLLLLLEVVLFKELYHLLSPRAKLAVELHHRHVLDNQVVGFLAPFRLSGGCDSYVYLLACLITILLLLLQKDVLDDG